MASKKVVLEGIANWAKVFESNRDKEGYKGAYADTNGRTTIELILTQDEMDKLKKAGSMKRGRPVEGGISVKLDRKWETGRDWDSGAPEVFRADGNPWDEATDGYIGNGSTVRVQAVVTPFPDKGVTSTRLEMVKVLELVPFASADDGFRADESGGVGQPKKDEAPVTAPAYAASTKDIDDSIPF